MILPLYSLANELPPTVLTVVGMLSVYSVLVASFSVNVSVYVLLSLLAAPVEPTAVEPLNSFIFESVSASIASVKSTLTFLTSESTLPIAGE